MTGVGEETELGMRSYPIIAVASENADLVFVGGEALPAGLSLLLESVSECG